MLCGLVAKEIYAGCSDATGKATINEVYKLTTGTGTASFVEIKIIDETLTSAVYDEWTLQVCYKPSKKNLDCKSYNVSDFIDNFPWLYIQAPTFEDKYLDFKKGFDITLRGDATDNGGADSQEVIDYLDTKNFFEQDLDGCSTGDLPYWFGSQSTNNGTKLAKRISDGTGGWEIVNSNDESETPGANNDGEPEPAPSCDAIFPGAQPFGGSGSIVTGSNRPLCNGVDCSFEGFTSVGSINLNSSLGSFPEQWGAWTFNDNEYNYYTSSPSGENYRLLTSGGTTAIYISGSSVFKKGAGLNVPFTGTGNPSELLIVVDGDLKIEENAVVNGFIYVKGDVVLEKGITFNGAVSATGTFDVKENGRYTYDTSMLNGFDPHGFCEPVSTPTIDHYQIIHDGNGLTCDAEIVTIKACTNTYDGSCTLSTDAVILDVKATGSSSVIDTISFTGTGTASIAYTIAESTVLSLENVSIAATNPTVCFDGSTTNCNLVFADTGFRFFSNTESMPIPEQISGKPSNTGFNSSPLKLQAVEKNPITGACEAALVDNVSVELSASCKNPSACIVGKKVVINSLATDTAISTQDNGATIAYSNVAMDFGTNIENVAEFVFTYPEAGQMQLHARYNIPDKNGAPSDNFMLGSSNNFVVRPFGFYVNVADNPKAQTAGGDKFIAAGEDFSTSLTAVQWQAADDDLSGEENDGVPDTGADLSDNTVTINFGNEIAPEQATITDMLYLPSPGTEGTLTNVDFTNFNGGIDTNTMTYNEVGIVNFNANLISGAYIGASDITGSEPYVGRFIPHHFKLTIGLDGELKSVCDLTSPSSEMTFAYSGQMSSESSGKGALQYLFRPEVIITPQAKLNTHTKNYTGDFDKLLLSGVSRFEVNDGTGTLVLAPIEDAVRDGVDDTNKVKLTANFTDGSLTEASGVLSFEYSLEDNFVYTHEQNSEILPFTSTIHLSLASVIDEDGVTADDADGNGDTGVAEDSVITLNPTGREIRFGRAYLENSFGPETSTLGQVLSVEYFDGTNFVLADTDTCTKYNSTNVSFGSPNEVSLDADDIPAVSGFFVDIVDEPDGVTRKIVLPAAGEGNQGAVEVIYDIYSWLEYDWDWNGVTAKEFNENPSAVATFGLFRGNDRIIYQREVH